MFAENAKMGKNSVICDKIKLWNNPFILLRCRLNNVSIPQEFFIGRPVSAVGPSPVTDNLRGGYYTIGLLIKIVLQNWSIIIQTPRHDNISFKYQSYENLYKIYLNASIAQNIWNHFPFVDLVEVHREEM